MRRAVMAAVIAVLIGAGLWFILSSNDAEPELTQEEDATPAQTSDQQTEEETANGQSSEQQQAAGQGEELIEVTYTSNGFEPREITISAGDTVTWTNQSGTAMRVASDDHPEHLAYPGFDQLNPGDSYSFTFDEPGTWGYHNHEDHNDTGLITVN